MKHGLIILMLLHFGFIQYSEQNFQLNLLTKILESNESSNTIISPLGIYNLLSILADGSLGQTRKEILKALFLNEEINLRNNNLKEYKKTKNLKISKNKLKSSNLLFDNINSLFVNNKTLITNEFSSLCKNNNIFLNISDLKEINNYNFNEKNGKLQEIITKIEKDSEFIIINDNIFRGRWAKKFNKENTKKLPFENFNHKIVEVETMNNIFKDVMYHEDNDVQMISLPFLSEKFKFKMIILLPNQSKYISPLNYLNQKKINLNELISKLKLTKSINLYLPKFDFEFGISLKKILNELDIKKAFSKEANFSKIFGNHLLNLHEIMHKTFIKINEEGADTQSDIVSNYINNSINNYSESINMNVNHSFIFLIVSDDIKDSENNYFLPFIGVINNLEGIILNDNNDNIFYNSSINEVNINKLKLSKILQKAYIRTRDDQNLTKINETEIKVLEDENNTNASSSSSGFYIIKNKEIKRSILLILLMTLFI